MNTKSTRRSVVVLCAGALVTGLTAFAGGTAGTIAKIETSMPLSRPDGLRSAGPKTLLQAEGQGRFTELTIDGNRAEVRVVKDGLSGATGLTLVGDTALVLVERAKAVLVPYRRP